MTPRDFRFRDSLRVRWAEVDMQRIVFNGHYLLYIDTAMAAYWRALALPYMDTMAMLGGDLFVRKTALEYHASAEYDDVLHVGLRCESIGNSSIRYGAGVFRADELLVSGELVYVYADPVAKESRPVPPDLRAILLGFEAGEAMVDVRLGEWETLGPDARAIRHEVFIDEQRIPAEMEWDGADPTCIHAVAYNRFGLPLATGRLLEHVPGVAKVGRMAVRRSMRGSHVGRALLDGLMDAARQRGDREMLLHAQISAAGFYSRLGFVARGPEFEEAGITHVEMVRQLA